MPRDIQPTPPTLATSSRAGGSPRHGSAAPSPPTSSSPRWPAASRSLSGLDRALRPPCASQLQRDHLVRRVARQRPVEVGKAADPHSRDRAAGAAIARLTLRERALDRALVA